MNKKQLEKMLKSINNKISEVKFSIVEASLTDDEFETILEESNYPIMCQVTIKNSEGSYIWPPTVNGIYTGETNPYTIYAEIGKPLSLNIEASSTVKLMLIQMDGVDIKDNTDLCTYTITDSGELYKPNIIDITIPNVTGDIYVLIDSEIPPS